MSLRAAGSLAQVSTHSILEMTCMQLQGLVKFLKEAYMVTED